MSTITWMVKLHMEKVQHRTRGDLLFEDLLCSEINYCSKYVDPEEIKKREIALNVEAVFA